MDSTRSPFSAVSHEDREAPRRRRWARAVAAVFLVVLALAGRGHASSSSPPPVQFYGFLRLDGVYDDSRMQHHQYAFWVLSEDEKAGPKDDCHKRSPLWLKQYRKPSLFCIPVT